MLAKKEKLKSEVFEICKNSPDIDIGDSFKGVISADSIYDYADKPCHCIGKVNDETRVFSLMICKVAFLFTVAGVKRATSFTLLVYATK